VYLEYFRVSIAGAKIRSAPPRRHKLASFTDLEFGEMRQVVLDASALLPGKLTGQIFLDGQPYANAKFGLRRSEIDGTGRLIGRGGRSGYKTDENGRFSAEVEGGYVSVFLTPGEKATSRGVPIEGADQLHVPPSRTTTGVFYLLRLTMRVRFLEHDGTPATQRYISRPGGRRFENLRTDGDGWLVLDPAPTESVTFYTWPKGLDDRGAMQQSFQERKTLRITLGPVQIPPGTNQAEFTLRLPADRH
jgi:hypothetical protein